MTTPRLARCAAGALVLLALSASGCLQQQVGDRAGYSANLKPEDAHVPPITSNALLAQQIANNAGVMGSVALKAGFAHGAPVHYWDFGAAANANAKAAWIFRRRNAGGELEAFGHPPLVDSIPGDTSYTALRSVFLVVVTHAYAGQRITNPNALDDALELGLIEEPKPLDAFVDWPIVPAETTLERGEGLPPLTPSPIYYRGFVARFFPIAGSDSELGELPIPQGPKGALPITTPDLFTLRKQNEARPLDANNVFSALPGEPGYSGLVRQVEVVMFPDYLVGLARAEEDLFDKAMMKRSARADRVVAYTETMSLFNRPIALLPSADDADAGASP